jgi:hypothetical protein
MPRPWASRLGAEGAPTEPRSGEAAAGEANYNFIAP